MPTPREELKSQIRNTIRNAIIQESIDFVKDVVEKEFKDLIKVDEED